jgi:hypothetical protein
LIYVKMLLLPFYNRYRIVNYNFTTSTYFFSELGYNGRNMKPKRIIGPLLFVLFLAVIVPGFSIAAGVNGDFTLWVTVNDQDITAEDTIVLEPEKDLEVELGIENGEQSLTLHGILISITFADVVIMTHREKLTNFHMAPGEFRSEKIVMDLKDRLKLGNLPLTTGIYRSKFELEYTVENRVEAWSQWKNIKIPGNPLTTTSGIGGAVIGLVTVAAILALVKSIISPTLPAGTDAPSGATVQALPELREYIMSRLESTTRGRAVGSIVNSAKKRIVRHKCPICDSRIRHGYCFTCRKSAKQVRAEYVNRLKELAIRGGELIANGQVVTMEQLCSLLDISGKLATDVIATLRHARLIKIKGLARKLVDKAVTAGICSGLSAIIWITIGGFIVLNAAALIIILLVALIIPFAITRIMQIRARRTIQKNVPLDTR